MSTNELVDAALKTNFAQDFDLNVDIDSIDVDDVLHLTVKLRYTNVMHHCCLLYY